MNVRKQSGCRTSLLLASMLVGAGLMPAQTQSDEIARLREALAAQQKQLQVLQQAIEQQQQALERVIATAQPQPSNLGSVASLKPLIPAVPVAAAALPFPAPQAAAKPPANPCEAAPGNEVPAYLRLGSVCIVPVGFMDLTTYWRDANAASSMGSNFGSIPYSNAVNGNLSEFHFSAQNSRLGFRVDGNWKGAHFIGYNEFDFNGTGGSTALAVSNGAIVPRLRLYWVDVRKGKLEFLAGQSWSMLVPNRRGISAIPGDLFYTQVVDINYIAGLTWTRQPGVRVLFHPNDKVTFGFSAEQPDQYIGGSAGGSGITLPAAFSALAGTQLDNAQNISAGGFLAQPGYTPDFIAKVAFDPNSHVHFDIAGLESNFKTVNPANLGQHFTATGAGVEVAGNVEVIKNFRLISPNYWSQGGGRYLFGQAPNLIVRADGTLSPVKSGGFTEGFEATVKNTLIYGHYGGVYIQRNVTLDANGSKIGYGYAGSPGSMNRAINEVTFGFNQTIWRNARYGAINFMAQYQWLQRNPWAVASGSPTNAHDNTIYTNIRYTLPGAMPSFN